MKKERSYQYKVQYVISSKGKVEQEFRRNKEACKWFLAYEKSNPGKYKLEQVVTGDTGCSVHERITVEDARKIVQGGTK